MSNPTPGMVVYFHEDGGPYPSFVTAVNPDGSLELVTFGRNSIYFQHNVQAARELPAGATYETAEVKGMWTWPPRAT